jgi:predicted ArsR family transcriptional regulator
VPETLHALIAARLDALEAVERSLVQDGAVLGQSFTVDALAAVAGLPADAVEEHLRNLVRRELLVHESDPRSPERGSTRSFKRSSRGRLRHACQTRPSGAPPCRGTPLRITRRRGAVRRPGAPLPGGLSLLVGWT